MELHIDDVVVKKLEELAKNEIHPTFRQYPIFEYAPGISIMGNMIENEDRKSKEENYEIKLIEDIVE